MKKIAALLMILLSATVFAQTAAPHKANPPKVPKWNRWVLTDKYSFQYDPAIWTRTTVGDSDVLCLNPATECNEFIDPHVFAGENGGTFTTMFFHVWESAQADPDIQITDHGKFDGQMEQAAFFSYMKGPYVVAEYAFPGTTKKMDDPTAVVFIGVFRTSAKYQESLDKIVSVVKTFTIMLPK